jgi:hypothetical protein
MENIEIFISMKVFYIGTESNDDRGDVSVTRKCSTFAGPVH